MSEGTFSDNAAHFPRCLFLLSVRDNVLVSFVIMFFVHLPLLLRNARLITFREIITLETITLHSLTGYVGKENLGNI